MSIVMSRSRPIGRHRLGRPGRIPVTALVTVVRRGFLASLLRPGRHRRARPAATQQAPARLPVAARAGDAVLSYPTAA